MQVLCIQNCWSVRSARSEEHAVVLGHALPVHEPARRIVLRRDELGVDRRAGAVREADVDDGDLGGPLRDRPGNRRPAPERPAGGAHATALADAAAGASAAPRGPVRQQGVEAAGAAVRVEVALRDREVLGGGPRALRRRA